MSSFKQTIERAVEEDILADFIREPIKGDIREVPFITEELIYILRDSGIYNTYQLIAKYLKLKDLNECIEYHHMKFMDWLESKKFTRKESEKVSVAIAEKVSTMMPGLYDPSIFAE